MHEIYKEKIDNAVDKLKALAVLLPEKITFRAIEEIRSRDTSVFSGGAAPSDPTKAAFWHVVIRANNAVDSTVKRDNAIKRVRGLINGLSLFNVMDLGVPAKDAECGVWLDSINGRLDAYTSGLCTKSTVGSTMIQQVFGLGAREVQTSNLSLGKWYGYRLSAASGDLVRFACELSDSNAGELEFSVFYGRYPHRFSISGPGFALGTVTHLIGTAKPNAEAPGLGIRVFTLMPYNELNWIVGLLETRDKQGMPVTTRVVLVPAEQHKEGRHLAFEPDSDLLIKYLRKGSNLEKFASEIEVAPSQSAHLNGFSPADLIRYMILNFSFRALHGAPQPIPRPENMVGFQRLLEIQQRFLHLRTLPVADCELLCECLQNDELYSALDHFLKHLEDGRKNRSIRELRKLLRTYQTKGKNDKDTPEDVCVCGRRL